MSTDWTSSKSVRQLFEEQEQKLGNSNPDLAVTATRLADLYFLEENYLEAERFYWRALELRQKILGEVHESVADSLKNLAELYEIQDRYAEAERFYQWHTTVQKKIKLQKHSDKLDSTMQMSTASLPQMTNLRQGSVCPNCNKPMLDSAVCMYCTKGVAYKDLLELAKKADAALASSPESNQRPANVLVDSKTNSRYSLTDPIITIGRHPSNAIVLRSDNCTSRHHATLTFNSGRFWLEDKAATNSSLVNGQRVSQPTPLQAGDVVTIGNTTFVAEFQASEP